MCVNHAGAPTLAEVAEHLADVGVTMLAEEWDALATHVKKSMRSLRMKTTETYI